MKKILENSISFFVVIMVLLLIIPLPTFALDVLFIINMALALIILLVSMNIQESLEFSIFPSLLLITTLFRLGLNISSTRLILTQQGAAGEVIEAFGEFVLQGNVVVGVIIFIIIVLVQLMVISKGAERVAEVAARFTLDAMPGKQMAIDADMNSGLIDEQEAKERRYKIQKEADFYGAMDGATKIVKGDATMSIIITVINFVAGVVIGMVQSTMEFTQVLEVYSIATIGDGLVSQIPSLMISTATAMIVTRAVSEGSLNTDVTGQFLAQPQAIMVAGGLIGFIGLLPGTPKLSLLTTSACLLGLGASSYRKIKAIERGDIPAPPKPGQPPQPAGELKMAGEEGGGEALQTEEEYYKDINNVYSLINVEPVEVEFGYSLIPLVDEGSGGKLINRIVIFRRQYAQDMGIVIPSIRLRDSVSLNTNEYTIKIRGEVVANGEILVDYFLALEPAVSTGDEIDGIDTIEPAYGIPSKWILPENKELAEIYGYTVIDPLSVMLTHMSEVISSHAHELLSRAEVVSLVENVKTIAPELVAEAFPAVLNYGLFQKILCNLLKEGIPVKDLVTIIETAVDSFATTRDIDTITENIRIALKRTITRKFCEGGQMKVINLDAEVERALVASMTKSDQGVYLSLNPELLQSVLVQLGDNIKKFHDISAKPVVITSHVIRIHFYRLIEQFYPNIYVLSFNEIGNNIQIQAIGNITVNPPAPKAAANK